MEAAYQIFRLLKSTPGKGLLLEKSEKNDVEAILMQIGLVIID